jgi:hypothetical protein
MVAVCSHNCYCFVPRCIFVTRIAIACISATIFVITILVDYLEKNYKTRKTISFMGW